MSIGGAQLYERWRRALRVRQSGADLKPPQAAAVKSRGGERCGNAGTRSWQARSREASASEPLQKCRKRIRRCQNRGVTLPPDQLGGCLSPTKHRSRKNQVRTGLPAGANGIRNLGPTCENIA